MPRLIRRLPLHKRILAHLNPLDVLLNLQTWWAGVSLEDDLQSSFAQLLGIFLNFLALLSFANGDKDALRYSQYDDLFRRPASARERFSGWGSSARYLFWVLSVVLAVGSAVNCYYLFTRMRRYRLFEANIEERPQTISARRVKVNSSPTPFNPFSAIADSLFSADDAASRAYPDAQNEVWEVAVWDPTPLSHKLFSYLSPVHIGVYWVLFASPPTTTTYIQVLIIQAIITAQTLYLSSAHIQQAHDRRLIQKEVLNEYDTKFVHPRLSTLARDVGVQVNPAGEGVVLGTPTYGKGEYRINPNPNYVHHTMQSGTPYTPAAAPQTRSRPNKSTLTPAARMLFKTPTTKPQPRYAEIGSQSVQPRMSSFQSAAEKYERANGIVPATERKAPLDASRVGVNGLVDWSRQNSRGLTASKGKNPLPGSRNIYPSTYAESLGTQLGTPRRRSRVDRERGRDREPRVTELGDGY